jgi:predicted nucleic acid-binding protein
MPTRRWVVDASPLILLGKVDQIQILGALASDIAVPGAVIREMKTRR